MQVAGSSAAATMRAVSLSVVADMRASSPTPKRTMSFSARWAIDYIAASTRLSDGQIRLLINLIADIDQHLNGDPKLMQKVIAIAKMMEMQSPEGSYRQHTAKELEEMYWDARNRMGGSNATTSAEAQISTLTQQYSPAATSSRDASATTTSMLA